MPLNFEGPFLTAFSRSTCMPPEFFQKMGPPLGGPDTSSHWWMRAFVLQSIRCLRVLLTRCTMICKLKFIEPNNTKRQISHECLHFSQDIMLVVQCVHALSSLRPMAQTPKDLC